MSVTINAHQLGRLIDKTIGHIGSEYVEPLHGIRLDVDASHLYAVATDRYTLAAARYRLNHDEQGQEPWARTIPAAWLKPLREWLDAQAGSLPVAIGTEAGRLAFATPHTEMRVPVTASQEFPDWRSLLRGVAANIHTIYAFPAVDSRMLARWADTDDVLRVRVTTDLKAFMVFGEDFIGVQMPKRYAGVGPCEDETFDQALALWPSIFSSGDTADMATDMPFEEDRPSWGASTDIRETGKDLLQTIMQANSDMLGKSTSEPDLFHAHIVGAVHGWMAYRYLDALYAADPRLAASVVAEVADQLDSGEIGEFAWDAAEKAGHDPQKWADDYEAHLKEQAAEPIATA